MDVYLKIRYDSMFFELNPHYLLIYLVLSLSCDRMKPSKIQKINILDTYECIIYILYETYFKLHDINYYFIKFLIISYFSLLEKDDLSLNLKHIVSSFATLFIGDPSTFYSYMFIGQYASFFKSIGRRKIYYYSNLGSSITFYIFLMYLYVQNFKNCPYSMYICK
jgi:hypothetical protein